MDFQEALVWDAFINMFQKHPMSNAVTVKKTKKQKTSKKNRRQHKLGTPDAWSDFVDMFSAYGPAIWSCENTCDARCPQTKKSKKKSKSKSVQMSVIATEKAQKSEYRQTDIPIIEDVFGDL